MPPISLFNVLETLQKLCVGQRGGLRVKLHYIHPYIHPSIHRSIHPSLRTYVHYITLHCITIQYNIRQYIHTSTCIHYLYRRINIHTNIICYYVLLIVFFISHRYLIIWSQIDRFPLRAEIWGNAYWSIQRLVPRREQKQSESSSDFLEAFDELRMYMKMMQPQP